MLDDGFGKRNHQHLGWKLNLAILEEIGIVRDFDGRFLRYEDKSMSGESSKIDSLEELIKSKQGFLEWTFKNDSVDEIATGFICEKREG